MQPFKRRLLTLRRFRCNRSNAKLGGKVDMDCGEKISLNLKIKIL
jgi:hypothetical protein